MSRKKPAIEEIIENDVAALRESKRIKKDDLAEIQKEFRRDEAALKSDGEGLSEKEEKHGRK